MCIASDEQDAPFATGDAITFVSPDKLRYFRRICQYIGIGRRFELRQYPQFELRNAEIEKFAKCNDFG
jgi:superfamily II DNA/RNA helicase